MQSAATCLLILLGGAGCVLAADETPRDLLATPYAEWKLGPSKSADYFPIAVWLQQPKYATRYKAAGINLYIGLWKGPTEQQLATLKAAKMPVICSQNAVGLKHKDDPLIVAWMHGDEPDNAQRIGRHWKTAEQIAEAWPGLPKKPLAKWGTYGPPIPPKYIIANYKTIKQRDPSRPVVLNLGQAVAWDGYIGRGVRSRHPEDYPEYIKGCDVVSFDIYPVVHRKPQIAGKLWYVPRGVERLRRWTKDEKAVWNCIECTRISNVKVKPTPAQVRSEVWMAIIHGSRGLVYFVHQFKPRFNDNALLDDAEMLKAVTALNKRIHSLAAVINSPTVDDAAVSVKSSNAATPVKTMTKKHGGATYVFAAAMRDEPTTGTFTVKGVGGATADVLGEDREVAVKGGSFTDTFDGYGVHLYKIK